MHVDILHVKALIDVFICNISAKRRSCLPTLNQKGHTAARVLTATAWWLQSQKRCRNRHWFLRFALPREVEKHQSLQSLLLDEV